MSELERTKQLLGPSGKPLAPAKCPNDSCDAGLNRRVKTSGFGGCEIYNCEKCGTEYPQGAKP